MDENEIWLSEDEEEFEGDDSDPTSFTMALTYQGQPGGKRSLASPDKYSVSQV